jgi:chromosome segregation ATPase
MRTLEERLSAVEQAQADIGESVKDLNHHVTTLIGIVQKQEWDIREIKSSLRSIDERLDGFDRRLTSLELQGNALERRMSSFEQQVNSRFEALETRFEAQEKKIDQIVLLLTTLTAKPGQET